MPTYDYKCKKCGTVFEVFQKMSDEPVANCPDCGGEAKRMISGGAGIHFKGSGFYVTDYKKSSNASSGTSHKPAPKAEKTDSCAGRPAAAPSDTAAK